MAYFFKSLAGLTTWDLHDPDRHIINSYTRHYKYCSGKRNRTSLTNDQNT